jgi:hypothetical protein
MYIKPLTTFPEVENDNAFFFPASTAKMNAENTFKIVLYLHMHEVQHVQKDLEYQCSNSRTWPSPFPTKINQVAYLTTSSHVHSHYLSFRQFHAEICCYEQCGVLVPYMMTRWHDMPTLYS